MTSTTSVSDIKEAAVTFLQLVVAGRIEEGYRQYVDMNGTHHNAFFHAGFPALQKAMLENHMQFPNKKISVYHVVHDGDFVAVHSNVVLKAGELSYATVHLFRFRGGRIVEMWDIGQSIPNDCPNSDGVF